MTTALNPARNGHPFHNFFAVLFEILALAAALYLAAALNSAGVYFNLPVPNLAYSGWLVPGFSIISVMFWAYSNGYADTHGAGNLDPDLWIIVGVMTTLITFVVSLVGMVGYTIWINCASIAARFASDWAGIVAFFTGG